MVRESARKCSHCGLNGHNCRTCGNFSRGNNNNNNCVKLFGVNLMENREELSMRKSLSMGNLNIIHRHFDLNNNAAAAGHDGDHDGGYLSDGLIHNKKRKAAHERKKGKAWTEEEHITFLAGLKKLGKGDWKGISKKFVTTRTATQVASHAQKYFLRKIITINNNNDNNNANHINKKRRPSLFDISAHQIKNSNISQEWEASCAVKERSQILLSNNSLQNQQQVSNLPAQLINRFPHLCLDTPHFVPPPTTVANLIGIPYLVGVSSNIEVGRGSSKSPIRRTSPNYEPMASHPSGIPSSPRSLMPSIISRSFGTGALDLKIGLPQSPQPKNLSSQTNSGAIRVI